MLTFFLVFWLTFAISFAGSVHPGPVNLSVIQATLRRGLSAGLWLAVGGCLPEILYGLLAVRGVMFFEKMPGIYRAMQVAVVPLMLVLGILTLRRKTTTEPVLAEVPPPVSASLLFWKGLTLSLLNPQLLPFWIVILVYYNGYPWLRVHSGGEQAAFVAGASLGAFGLLYLYARLVHRRREQLARYVRPERFDVVMGWGFIALAAWQGLRLLLN